MANFTVESNCGNGCNDQIVLNITPLNDCSDDIVVTADCGCCTPSSMNVEGTITINSLTLPLPSEPITCNGSVTFTNSASSGDTVSVNLFASTSGTTCTSASANYSCP